MTIGRNISRRAALAGLGTTTLAALAACSAGDMSFGPGSTISGARPAPDNQPIASGRTLGRGPVRVALLLPLSGEPGLVAVGTSMANAAELAMAFIETNPNIGENTTILVRDTGTTAQGAASAAGQALAEGASVILGPLRADQVSAAAGAARAAGVPVIGFSNNTGAAAPGVYLLNVLPETEARRSVGYALKLGKRAFAAIVPTTDFGRIQESAYRQALADLGANNRAIYTFSNEAEARALVSRIAPQLKSGEVDALFIPDRATAPSFGNLLAEAGIAPGAVQLIGSGDWNNDASIANTTTLAGAIFPALDDAGLQALTSEYQLRFGGAPHPLATLAYTATILANASTLSNASPRYNRAALTSTTGFNGRDGAFRFFEDGRSEFALTIRQVSIGGSTVVEAAPTRFQ